VGYVSSTTECNFEWLSLDFEDFAEFERILHKILPDSKYGFFIECDLEYPTSLHDFHNDYPLAVEVLAPKDEWLSSYQKKLVRMGKLVKTNKLKPKKRCPTLP
jgi:hypothetical protein